MMNFLSRCSLFIFTISIATFSTGSKAQELTDEQALAEGMTPAEMFLFSEMRAVVTPGLSSAGVLQASQAHRLVIAINKAKEGPTAQTLTMYENGVEILREKISTGREQTENSKSGRVYFSTTPKGYFRPTKLYTDYMSYTWKAQMPNAVFFIGGIAIHATNEESYSKLGTRASGGCIRTIKEASLVIRKKIMETGRGDQPGQFRLVSEGQGRRRVTNNSVSVAQINRNSGALLRNFVESWDTVIIVYEE